LILDSCARDPEKRLPVDMIVTRLQAMDKELFPPEYHLKMNVLKTCEQLEQLIHAKRLEGLYHVSPYVTEYEVLESIESYWSRFEDNSDKNIYESKNNSVGDNNKEEKNVSIANSPLPLMSRLEAFLDNPDCNGLVLLGDSGLGKSLSTYLFSDQLKKCWTYLNQNTTDTEKLPICPYSSALR